jgi:hypothetical protein
MSLLCLLGTGCSAEILQNDLTEGEELSGKKIVHAWGFNVTVNQNIEISTSSPVSDFELYEFKYNNKDFLHAYSGNHPNFPSKAPKNIKEESLIIGTLSAKCIEWQSVTSKYSKECLISLGEDRGFPQFVHFWYYDMTLMYKEYADNIILSIEKSLRK